ncbi:(2Fe-2S)-binding protein [Candidatus Caldatribacterium sp. SIUC1]|uniref:(2Fe-2S)-binding protein n=1 Tax=Candidatus Caldatribacterium sp. SIUC1 TaxID=3418365 RepID=UPI003F68EF97
MEKALCPVCHGEGQNVLTLTVKHLVREALRDTVNETVTYCLCLNPHCPVVYFDASGKTLKKEDLKVPVWYKDGASPKYICYCSRVTEEEILSAIRKGARTLEDIQRMTGAGSKGFCLTENPSGRCCHREIAKILKRACESSLRGQ